MSLLELAISWLAPATCVTCGAEGSPLCLACQFSEIVPFGERCWHCGQLSLRSKVCPPACRQGSPNHVFISAGYDSAVQKLIQRYKFSHQRACASSIASLMAQTLFDQNSDEQLCAKNYLLIPVPTAASRVRQRGFDHTALLAEKLATILQMERAEALGRLGSSAQVGAGRTSRLKQAKGSYFIKKPVVIAGRNILLIDDVVTTGATLSETARVLRVGGARAVDALVFAKSL
ncbi:MAG TPA: ComF family protein [Candidatus Saccharimonadales bacterium]|nr:ComF family protein [Candidatus Saccharimonadales bacterium]